VTGIALLMFASTTQAAEATTSDHDPLPTKAGAFSLKIEPGVAFPLTKPQSDLFKLGGGQTIKAFWAINRHLDIGPSATFLALPTDSSLSDFGTAWAFGGSARYHRPHDLPDDAAFKAISPWVDADALYVRTGKLNRPGFAVAAGLSVPVGETRYFWIGPFVRYFQIIQLGQSGFNTADAKILSVGLSLEVGSGVRRPRDPVAPAEIRTITNEITKETFTCPDRDGDGIPDAVDRCPDVKGTADDYGCPYKKVVIRKDKLELKEKLYFEWNKAVLQDVSYGVLDEVAQALQDNKGFRVQVQGHASSEGGDERNQQLSEQRAEAVLDYLASRGVAKDRLTSKGFSSSVPAGTNTTEAGREKNRRVEFVVYFIILNDGSK
jgi:outer membrane protein OmpA-like peptidoglycan-associated protein